MSNITKTQAAQSSMAAIERKALIEALREAADADGMALYHLTNIIKLAAFACESRRALEGITFVLREHPVADNDVKNTIPAVHEWDTMHAAAGEVLQHVATQMKELNEVIGKRSRELEERFRGAA